MDLDSLIAKAQDKIGALIQKPKMTEKLLSKPPFRFLHDTISAVISTTGFGEGLYNDQEKDSSTINEKQQKLDYLDKIFRLVGICQGQSLEVKSIKVVAGLEPELTNIFLISLAECASNPSIDNENAVQRCLNGEEPGSGSIPKKTTSPQRASKPSKAESKNADDSKPISKESPVRDTRDRDRSENTTPKSDAKAVRSSERDQSSNPTAAAIEAMSSATGGERGVSRGGSRGGKPNTATPDIALSGVAAVSRPDNLDALIEQCDGREELTQTMLGELISRPKLTSKLLGKPPFRFLFDIVVEVISATGFGSGLYNDSEIDSANITEKQQKLDFLEKIIKLVGIQLNTLVEARPAKIVAGLDAQITNSFLQLLALAAKLMPDSSRAVKMVLQTLGGGATENTVTNSSNSRTNSADKDHRLNSAESKTAAPSNKVKDDDKGGISTSRGKSSSGIASPILETPVLDRNNRDLSSAAESKSNVGGNNLLAQMNKVVSGETPDIESDEMKRSARPSTAGRRPPRVKDNVVTAPESAVPAPLITEVKATGILIEGQDDDDDIPDESDNVRLADDQADGKDMLQVVGTGAGGADSKLVKDILSRQAEQAAQSENKSNGEKEDAPGNNGGIRLMRKGGRGSGAGGSSDSRAGESKQLGGGGIGGSTLTEDDMKRLSEHIQSLVRQTGPLGTCMDFIQEDIDHSTMTTELRKWEDESKRYEIMYQEESKKSREVLRPLEMELTDLSEQVREKILHISTLKGVILRNEERLYDVYKTGAVLSNA